MDQGFIVGELGAQELIILLLPLFFLVILIIAAVASFLFRKKKQNVSMKKCPHCRQMIRAESKMCRFCYRDVSV